jgi:hypothetical protein
MDTEKISYPANSSARNSHMTILNIGNEAFNSIEIANKVEGDINFLNERIRLLERQFNPNPVVLATFYDMLHNRQAVLDWLLQDHKIAANQ